MIAYQSAAPAPMATAPLARVERPAPAPGPGEVRLRVAACGICHTDLHVLEGDLPAHKLPIVPGHQIVGRVDTVGKGITGLRVGERVGMPWLYATCGVCVYCRSARENLCREARFTGYDVDGGCAEYVVAQEGFVIPLPEAISDEAAAPLLCAGVIGYRALRMAKLQPGERLGLYGFGASAHLTIQVAVHQDAQVYVYTRSPEHQRLALELGAAWAGSAEAPLKAPLDAAIIFAPAGWLVPAALRVLDRGGRLVLAGIYMSPIPELPYADLYYERSVQTVANATRQDATEFMRLAAEIPVRTEVQRFPLSEANRALQLLKAGQIQGAGVLIVE